MDNMDGLDSMDVAVRASILGEEFSDRNIESRCGR
jgi:hypothetical protein